MTATKKVYSPIIRGSGAIIVHKQLQDNIQGYSVNPLNPLWSTFPIGAHFLQKDNPIVHSSPDLGSSIVNKDSKFVVTFHNYYLDDEHLSEASLAQKLYYKLVLSKSVESAIHRADKIVAVSNYIADLIKSHHNFDADLEVIYNGINTQHFYPVQNRHTQIRKVSVLFAGNPILRKGGALLNIVANGISPKAKLFFTTGMRKTSTLPSNSNLYPIQSVPHAEMPKIYNNSDILFFPTYREGFGLVVAEAMACGLPIVSTQCSALPELVVHGKGGFLAEPGNTDEMIHYINMLANNPEMRAEMGSFNREIITNKYTEEKMVKNYNGLFSSL